MARDKTSTHPTGYDTPTAFWAAVDSQLRNARDQDPELKIDSLRRQFVYHRLLARVFHQPDRKWVLKGGTALLTRINSARHSKDIDLLHDDPSLAGAVDELHQLAGLDLVDHFRFVLSRPTIAMQRRGQNTTELAKVQVEAYVGARKVESFSIDIVVGSIITTAPDTVRPKVPLEVLALAQPDYLLYPVVDHVADKVCATYELYGDAQAPSSRVRDMVDLVVIARTQVIDAAALYHAVETERQHRGLAPFTTFKTPPLWRRSYETQAKTVAECVDHATYELGLSLVKGMLDPVLAGKITRATWQPTQTTWRATD